MSEPYDPNRLSNWDFGSAASGYSGPPPVGMSQPYPDQGSEPGYPTPAYPNTAYPNTAYPNAAFPNTAYPNTAYPNTAYPNPVYGPTGYLGAPYAPPGYSIYPMPGAQLYGRPGQIIGAAVLGYIEAGLLILAGLILFSGSSAVSSWSNESHTSDQGWGTQFAIAGLGDLIAAALLIAGGVAFSGGRPLGRKLMSIGLGVCVAEAIFWIVRLGDTNGAILPWVAFFLAMPIIATSLSYSAGVRAWLAFASSTRPQG